MNLFIPERNALYTLLGPACDNAPNSCRIALEHCDTLFRPGERVTFGPDGITAGHDKYVDLTCCQQWQPESLYFNGSRGWPTVGDLIIESIKECGSLFYFNGENVFYREMSRLLKLYRSQLLLSLRAGESRTAEKAAVNLMGLGIGLTPTGDDYLAGLSIILFIPGSPGQKYRDIFLTALASGKEKTTLLSAITLREAIAQRYREIIHRFVFELIANDQRDIQHAINEIKQIGSSSGCDMLCGMADALALTAYLGGEYVYQDCD